MGQKIATEEDYWTCTQGIMPARMQSIQLTVKQKDGKRYLLKTDTATASAGDFVCKWMMLLMAAIAAIVAVAIVATGGAALAVIVAAGAIAGAAGAAVGSIAGGLVCGQKAALIRTWSEEKHNLVIAGQKTLTSASMMKCPVFGAEIKRAPNIKNWWQALLVGFGNFGTTVVEGALGGAMIGTVGALAAGAATLAAPTLGTVWANVAGSFTGIGLAIRGVFGANEASNEWASGKVNNMGEAAQSFGSGAVPEAGSLKRIATGQAQPSDALLLLYFLHLKTPVKEPAAPKEEEGQAKQEETNGPKPANEPEPVKEGEDGKAYEATPDPKETPVLELPENVYHMKSDQFVQGVVDAIDPQYFQKSNRYSDGFYIAQKGETAIAEVTYHGGDAAKAKIIRFDLDKSNLKILDLTNPDIANQWKLNEAKVWENEAVNSGDVSQVERKYEKFQEIAEKAKDDGYNAIKFESARGEGYNYVVYGDSKSFFADILKPQMVMPAIK